MTARRLRLGWPNAETSFADFHIVFRNGTKEQWDASNPILLENELGVETDTETIKVGDGKTAWRNLGAEDERSLYSLIVKSVEKR